MNSLCTCEFAALRVKELHPLCLELKAAILPQLPVVAPTLLHLSRASAAYSCLLCCDACFTSRSLLRHSVHSPAPLPSLRHRDLDSTYLDATPDYMHVPSAACRIASVFPKAKLVVMIKDPVMRALSGWNMVRHQGKFNVRSFGEEVRGTGRVL